MRIPLISAVVAVGALVAVAAAAHGWSDEREATTVSVNECSLAAMHHHAGHMMHHRGHAASRCDEARIAPPIEERTARIERRADAGEWRDHERCEGDRCGDRDEGWRARDEGWRGADAGRRMFEDQGRGYADRGMRYEHEGPDMSFERRAYVDGAVHHEDEDRRGWNDREYAERDRGLHRDAGMDRWGVHEVEREQSWTQGEHWLGDCGCGPARPSATDEYGYLVWSGKVVPEGYPEAPTWEVRP